MSENYDDSPVDCGDDLLKKFVDLQNEDILQALMKSKINEDTPHPHIRRDVFYRKLQNAPSQSEESVSFENLCSNLMENKLSAVIGPYGSGKTTLLMRVLSYSIQNLTDHYCIFLKLSDMDYNEDISLKELLQCNSPNLSEIEFNKAFEKLLLNLDKCLVILDGFDEAKWWKEMKAKPPNLTNDKKAPIWQIIGNLLKKHLLRKAHIVFTSRSFAMLVLPDSLRPSDIFVIEGFSSQTVQDEAGAAWITMQKKIPSIIDLCCIPLFFNHVLEFLSEKVPDVVTIGTVLNSVHECLRNDRRARQNVTKEESMLQSLAFSCKSSFTIDEVMKHLTTIDTIQDFVEASPETLKPNSKIDMSKVLFRFFNSSIQAYLAACHLSQCDPLDLKNHIANTADDVRRNLCGILFHKDLQGGKTIEQIVAKRDDFKELMQRWLNEDTPTGMLLKCLIDMREGGEDLLKELSNEFPVFVDCHDMSLSLSDVDALCGMVKAATKDIVFLSLCNCKLGNDSLVEIQTAIQQMNIKIEELDLSKNHFTGEVIQNLEDNFYSKLDKITILPQHGSETWETSHLGQGFHMTGEHAAHVSNTIVQGTTGEECERAFVDERSDVKSLEDESAERSHPRGDLHDESTYDADTSGTNEMNVGSPPTFVDIQNQPEVFEQDTSPELQNDSQQVGSGSSSSKQSVTAFLQGQEYIKLEKICCGMATVSICQGSFDRNFYASKDCNSDLYENLAPELETMGSLKHPNCVIYYTVAHDDKVNRPVIVMELCIATVRQFINGGKQKCIDINLGKNIEVPDIRKYLPISPWEIAKQSIKGVAYLHKKGFVHRDIKPENFLLTRNDNGCVVKVADFGLTRKPEGNRSSTKSQSRGSVSYMAPENHDGTFAFASDVFSFAIYLFEVLTLGQHPYGEQPHQQQFYIKENGPPDLSCLESQAYAEIEKKLPEEHRLAEDQRISACDMFRRMLPHERRDRRNIRCVESHPTFWNAKKKVEYFVDVQKTIEKLPAEAVDHLKLDQYDQMYPKITKKAFPAACLKAYKHRVVYDVKKDILLQLIKAIRDKAAHIGSLVENENNALGVTKSFPKSSPDEQTDAIAAFTDEEIKTYGVSKLGRKIEVCWEKFYEAFTGKAPHVLVHVYEKFRSEGIVNREEYYPPQQTSGLAWE